MDLKYWDDYRDAPRTDAEPPIEPDPRPQKRVGAVAPMRIGNEAGERVHGYLTAAVVAALSDLEPGIDRARDLEKRLRSAQVDEIAIELADGMGERMLLGSQDDDNALRLMQELEPGQLLAIAQTLDDSVRQLEEQGDFWPEGRLNAGIVHAALGDYERAAELLNDAVDLLSGRDIRRLDAAMAV